MKTARLTIPAVSKEMDFCARYARYMEEILETEPSSNLGRVTEEVALRANADAAKLLHALESAVSDAAAHVIRLSWVNTNRGESWGSWARVYMPRGPMRRIASTGVMLEDGPMALRLIGWVWPRWGGLDGRRRLVHACHEKLKAVCFPHEQPERYPGWKEDDGIVWLDEQLSVRSEVDEIVTLVSKQARRFFRAARPVLKELADR